MDVGRSDQRGAYREAMRELAEVGESPERLPPATETERGGPSREAGFYGELNWEWDGVQRGPYSGKGPKDFHRSDERIRDEVCEAMRMDGDLDASDLTVEVREGEVVHEGTVPDRRSKRRAEDLADRQAGVRDVHNRLRIAR